MLYSLVLELESEGRIPPRWRVGYGVYGLFLWTLGQRWPGLARSLHDRTRGPLSRFTVSPLSPRKSAAEDRLLRWLLRVTFMEEGLMARFVDAVLSIPEDAHIELGGTGIRPVSLKAAPGLHPLCRIATLETLWDTATPSSEIRVRFRSPTVVGRRGRRLLFPGPGLVLEGLRTRWNALASSGLRLSFSQNPDQWMALHVGTLTTRRVNTGDRVAWGFTGEVRFSGRPGARPEDMRVASALLDLAFFCGLGEHTEMGMGQCHLIRGPRVSRETRETTIAIDRKDLRV